LEFESIGWWGKSGKVLRLLEQCGYFTDRYSSLAHHVATVLLGRVRCYPQPVNTIKSSGLQLLSLRMCDDVVRHDGDVLICAYS